VDDSYSYVENAIFYEDDEDPSSRDKKISAVSGTKLQSNGPTINSGYTTYRSGYTNEMVNTVRLGPLLNVDAHIMSIWMQ